MVYEMDYIVWSTEGGTHDSIEWLLFVLFLEDEVVGVIEDELLWGVGVITDVFRHFSGFLDTWREDVYPVILIRTEAIVFITVIIDSLTILIESSKADSNSFCTIFNPSFYNRTRIPYFIKSINIIPNIQLHPPIIIRCPLSNFIKKRHIFPTIKILTIMIFNIIFLIIFTYYFTSSPWTITSRCNIWFDNIYLLSYLWLIII